MSLRNMALTGPSVLYPSSPFVQLLAGFLETCNSVKTKRLFTYMAEKGSSPWAKQLDLQKVDFGKGDRTVVGGGRLDPKYRITVPRGRAG